jgi:hypothetical protein
MDDLVLVGTVAIIGLYGTAVLVAAAALLILLQLFQAAGAGNSGRVMVILAGILIVVTLYAGIGLWLQKTGRI